MAEHPEQYPAAALSGDESIFSQYLSETWQPFLLLGEAGGQAALIRFTGYFEGKPVVWKCHFVTLAYRTGRHSAYIETSSTEPQRCFIDVGQPGNSGVPLRVCLDLPCISIPAIRKMIIMIRNYKRLRRGRHEFTA